MLAPYRRKNNIMYYRLPALMYVICLNAKKTFLREFMTVPLTFKDQLEIDQW